MWICKNKGPTCKVHLCFFIEFTPGVILSLDLLFEVVIIQLNLTSLLEFSGFKFDWIMTSYDVNKIQIYVKIWKFFVKIFSIPISRKVDRMKW